MTAYQLQLLRTVDGLSDVHMQTILQIVRSFRDSIEFEKANAANNALQKTGKRQLGIARGRTMIADGYDFDESNHEIAGMFEDAQ